MQERTLQGPVHSGKKALREPVNLEKGEELRVAALERAQAMEWVDGLT